MHVPGLRTALNSAGHYKYVPPEYVVDHLVVGAGVVGLAIAKRLAERFPHKITFLVERHPRAGEETSSRNSEVIHSGLYYPPDSLKTRLCLRGRELLYAHCHEHGIPHRRTGKLVVAHARQLPYIHALHARARALEWPVHDPARAQHARALPTRLLSGDEARAMVPALGKDIAGALWSPETGIVDAHGLMETLERDIALSEAGQLVYGTRVVRVDPYDRSRGSGPDLGEDGWVVQTVSGEDGHGDAVLARTLINASGLSATHILNALLPPDKRIPMWFPRGSYASYKGPGTRGIKHLIYPCPDTDTGSAGFQSLGTHLTLDLAGRIKFGPDLEWLTPPPDSDADADPDFWARHLVPDEARLDAMFADVRTYLPRIARDKLRVDYAGIRPKLVGPGGGFQDFVVRRDWARDFVGGVRDSRTGHEGGLMVSLMGIESPGLTASLAIAEMVVG